MQLLLITEKYVDCRVVFFDLMSILYIDFKNYLLDERPNYYHTKPIDM